MIPKTEVCYFVACCLLILLHPVKTKVYFEWTLHALKSRTLAEAQVIVVKSWRACLRAWRQSQVATGYFLMYLCLQ